MTTYLPLTCLSCDHFTRCEIVDHVPRESDARHALALVAALETELHRPLPRRARVEVMLANLERLGARHGDQDLLAIVIASYVRRARALSARADESHLDEVRQAMQSLLHDHFGAVTA